VELTRFATPSDETGLVRWAKTVSGARIRRKAELATRDPISEVQSAHASRSLSMWFYDEHRRFHLDAELSAADGAVIAKAIRRQAEKVPQAPDPEGPEGVGRRLADGLVRVCSGAIARDPDPDRATVVVHVQARALTEPPTGERRPEDWTRLRHGAHYGSRGDPRRDHLGRDRLWPGDPSRHRPTSGL
jgi:hypothetical protein